ncbi:GCN5 family acetyltransferase [Vibrio sp. UCD-FRSSP16_10]|uniref:GNAT family N-acetyltransferase n=1 Tax=unclassified Vibrio TaxID=2614977 RepID=UPI0007FBA1D3|nr:MULTISPECIES: GNAT family N-acetyltransferase [unclassified Vibrio]OBT14797.1 GCN5 family acetyltransferase [Vibrio sp. UCD-FRSSP16_30]OBT20086.1 GCN5 family acetyltransferase [Vibrio sp. UCD-FRSSP16_10]
MEVKFLENNADYTQVLDVLLQLRPSYSLDSLSIQIAKQQRDGYQVVYVKSSEGVLAVAGFWFGEKLAWGKNIYIDDLVTNPLFRSQGVGSFLIAWFKSHALDNDCEQIHLDSGVQRFSAHKFYLREDFKIASHHFSLLDLK